MLALAKHPNIHFLGVRRYPGVLRYIRHFDVAIVPHLDNELTRNMNPLKLYVYSALQVPIVATPIANTDAIGRFIEVGRTNDEFVERIEHCLSQGDNGIRTAQLGELLRGNSWDNRVEEIVVLVDQALEAKQRVGPPVP